MRPVKLIVFVLVVLTTRLYSQSIMIDYKPRTMKFDGPTIQLDLPRPSINYYYLAQQNSVIDQYSLMIYKSPVQHTAFFCRMEDITVKKFGVMIQLHVGNYQSYMDYKIPD